MRWGAAAGPRCATSQLQLGGSTERPPARQPPQRARIIAIVLLQAASGRCLGPGDFKQRPPQHLQAQCLHGPVLSHNPQQTPTSEACGRQGDAKYQWGACRKVTVHPKRGCSSPEGKDQVMRKSSRKLGLH